MLKQRPSLDALLSSAQLPAMPQSAIRLMQLSQDPDNGPAEYAVPIESDPGLTVQVLRFVNSSYFGVSREISSIKLAITLLGIRTIKNFALWNAVFSLLPNPKCGPFTVKRLWQDSLRRGLFARTMANIAGFKDAEDYFAAALLQDMAIPLLARQLPEAYEELLQNRGDGTSRLSQLERDRFGWTHAEAAGWMARRWKLPDGFAKLIELHTNLEHSLGVKTPQPGVLTVGLSALLPSASDSIWPERDAFVSAYQHIAGPAAPALQQVLAEVDHDCKEVAPALKIAAPPVSLIEAMEQRISA